VKSGFPLPAILHSEGQHITLPLKKDTRNVLRATARKMREDLARVLDLTSFGLGQMTIGTLLNRMVLGHIDNMTGEISVLKGLQGAKG